MKRIYFLLISFFIVNSVFAQLQPGYNGNHSSTETWRIVIEKTIHIPYGLTPSLNGGAAIPGALFYRTSDTSLYIYDGIQFLKVSGSGGGTGGGASYLGGLFDVDTSGKTLKPLFGFNNSSGKWEPVDMPSVERDSLVWKLNGNSFPWADLFYQPRLGTIDSFPLVLITNNAYRMIIPADGINQSNGDSLRSLMIDTVTHKLYWKNIIGSSGLDTSGIRGLFSVTSPLIYSGGNYSLAGLSGVGSNGQLIRSNGSTWEYFTPSYLTSETDPLSVHIGDSSSMLSPYLRTAGDLSPLFTTSVASHNLSFSLSNSNAYKVFGRASGTGAPSYLSLDSNFIAGFSTYVRPLISLTTTGTSGAATYNNTTGVFNIPNYGSATPVNIYNSDGTIPALASRTLYADRSTLTMTSTSFNSPDSTYFGLSLLGNDAQLTGLWGHYSHRIETGRFGNLFSSAYTNSGSNSSSSFIDQEISPTTGEIFLRVQQYTTYPTGKTEHSIDMLQNGITFAQTGNSALNLILSGLPNGGSLSDSLLIATSGGTVKKMNTNRFQAAGSYVTSIGLTTGTSGSDVNVSGSPVTGSGTITLNIPTASASNRGVVSTADWSTFNGKENVLTFQQSLSRTSNTINLVNDATSPGNNYIYATNSIGIKGWFPFSADSISSSQNLNNWRKDTTLIWSMNTGVVSSSDNFTAGSTYVSSTTETVVSDGLLIDNTDASGFASSPANKFAWRNDDTSAAINATLVGKFRYISHRSSTSCLGVSFHTTNAAIGSNDVIAYIPNTNAIQMRTANINFTLGTFPTSLARNDVVRITVNRNFLNYNVTVENITQRIKRSYTFYDSITAPKKTPFNPGYTIMNDSIVIQDLHYLVNVYKPDILFIDNSIGSGIIQTGNYSKPNLQDSTYWGRMDRKLAKKTYMWGQTALQTSEALGGLQEIRKISPEAVIVSTIFNDIELSVDSATWHARFKRLIDSLTGFGIKVIVRRIPPSTHHNPIEANAWIDSTYSNNAKVLILNDFETLAPWYDTGFTNDANTAYLYDFAHPNFAGTEIWAAYDATQIEKLFKRHNVSGAPDVNWTRKDKQILLYENTATRQGNWNAKILGSEFTLSGDTLHVTSSGVTTVGEYDTQTPNPNGAVISGSSIYFQTFTTENPGMVPVGGDNTKVLFGDGWHTLSGGGDMVLASVQSVTGLKTFDKDKLAMKGTSTGVTTISTANTSGTNYTATLQAATGTLAYMSDITVTSTDRRIAFQVAVATDANITASAGYAYSLPASTLSTNRNIDMTNLNTNGDYVEIDNQETGFTWTFTGQTVYDAYENSVTTLLANARYIIRRTNGKLKIIN